jgi:hypothetical protein
LSARLRELLISNDDEVVRAFLLDEKLLKVFEAVEA